MRDVVAKNGDSLERKKGVIEGNNRGEGIDRLSGNQKREELQRGARISSYPKPSVGP